jgi:NitT/TauT family transport system permease protein
VAARRRPGLFALWSCRTLVALVILGVWQWGAGRWFDMLWTSSPLDVGTFIITWARGDLLRQLLVTARETLIGYVGGSLLGIATGAVLARLEFVSAVLDPFIVALNGIPRIALAPLFIIWFGIGDLSKIVLAGMLTFFLCFYATMSGLRAVDQQHINIARVMRANRSQVFFKVALPSAFPWIITALKLGLPFALIGAIVGEFIASTSGIGYMIRLYTSQFDTTGAMSGIMILMLCIILLNAVLDRLEAYVLRWRPKADMIAGAQQQ